MRAVVAGLALVLVSSAAFAQQPATAASPAGAPRTMVSAADVAALIAKAKVDRKDTQALLAQSLGGKRDGIASYYRSRPLLLYGL